MTQYLSRHKEALEKLDPLDIKSVLYTLNKARKNRQTIFVIGNGGSAANASHFVEDLVKGANDAIPYTKFKALSLCDSVPFITAIGNDYSFEDIYVKQMAPLAACEDVLLGISVSGTSPNLIRAFDWANNNGMDTIAITGLQATTTEKPSIWSKAYNRIAIHSEEYGIVEDLQMTILHMLCYYMMDHPNA